MADTLLITSTAAQTRAALLDDGLPVEIHVETRGSHDIVGNIYYGLVVRVLPGMQAAFVNVGVGRTAFLFVDDAVPSSMRRAPAAGPSAAAAGKTAVTTPLMRGKSPDAAAAEPPPEAGERVIAVGRENAPAPAAPAGGAGAYAAAAVKAPSGAATTAPLRPNFRSAPVARIEAILKVGQQIIVQVQKAPVGDKGARLTCHIGLPSRLLIFTPTVAHIGVSQRIVSAAARLRLKTCLGAAAPSGGGFIARTAAQPVDDEILLREAQSLVRTWDKIVARSLQPMRTRLLHAEPSLIHRTLRELVDAQVRRVVVDDAAVCADLQHYYSHTGQSTVPHITLHTGAVDMFEHYGVEAAIDHALKRRVPLASGGFLIFDHAEALTVIDVNSGRYVGKHSLEDTTFKVNMEAVTQIAYQLRLRNIGGIIIIDFIDMAQVQNRQAVLCALAAALKADRARSTLVSMSALSLVQLTRQRTRPTLGDVLQEPCAYCSGVGLVKRPMAVAQQVLRQAAQLLRQTPVPQLTLRVEPAVAAHLAQVEAAAVSALEARFGTRIVCAAEPSLHRNNISLQAGTATD